MPGPAARRYERAGQGYDSAALVAAGELDRGRYRRRTRVARLRNRLPDFRRLGPRSQKPATSLPGFCRAALRGGPGWGVGPGRAHLSYRPELLRWAFPR
ncbi:hypothetical protein A8B98_00305 [Hymenobacter sp. UV11]|nr:hypothetical protein A8B98_00305 [Hymenobacter sp. UV11]